DCGHRRIRRVLADLATLDESNWRTGIDVSRRVLIGKSVSKIARLAERLSDAYDRDVANCLAGVRSHLLHSKLITAGDPSMPEETDSAFPALAGELRLDKPGFHCQRFGGRSDLPGDD